MDTKQRTEATQTVWGMLVFILIGLAWTGAIGDDVLPVIVLGLIAGVAATGFIWNWGGALQNNTDVHSRRKSLDDDILADVEDALHELDVALDDMLDMKQDGGGKQKRKREQIDAALRKMSDEELLELRQRLSTGNVSGEVLYQQLIDDDGELVYAEKTR